jgi:hypothetical protein
MKMRTAAARQHILNAANFKRPIALPDFTHRTIQQAVFKVRQRGLVPADVLVAAGYNAKGGK